MKDNHIVMVGELTISHKPDYRGAVESVFDRVYGERKTLMPPTIEILVRHQSQDIALSMDRGGAGD